MIVLTIGYVITILLFIVLIATLEREHKREREQLYNRLMARDYQEYTAMNRELPKGSKNFIQSGMLRAVREQYGDIGKEG